MKRRRGKDDAVELMIIVMRRRRPVRRSEMKTKNETMIGRDDGYDNAGNDLMKTMRFSS